VRRLTWPEMVEYWREHGRRFGNLDYERDPGGLANVCGPGQPLWLGEHLARSQRRIFGHLLRSVEPPRPEERALDVGTGAGRWAKVLADAGYVTTGIDLQGSLIADNRVRFPELEFHEVSVQDYRSESPFELVASVTVLQHIPFDEQAIVADRFRELTKPGGHVIVLEHILDQSPHVFSRTAEGWRALFGEAGFECVAARPFNYGPAVRSYSAVRTLFKSPSWTGRDDEALRPEDLVAQPQRAARSGPHRALRAVDRAALRTAVALDGPLEPLLVRFRTRRPGPADCGFLFRRA
jgi:2-polyprenyl-3-methyl-5-hydroxy-6-metoxy-1,4-benzoquinol methylase